MHTSTGTESASDRLMCGWESFSSSFWLSSWNTFQNVWCWYISPVMLALNFFQLCCFFVSSLSVFSWHELEPCGTVKENLVQGQNSQIWCFRGTYKVWFYRNLPNSFIQTSANYCVRDQRDTSVSGHQHKNIYESISSISNSLIVCKEKWMPAL